jgi:hypothetical protein
MLRAIPAPYPFRAGLFGEQNHYRCSEKKTSLPCTRDRQLPFVAGREDSSGLRGRARGRRTSLNTNSPTSGVNVPVDYGQGLSF